MAFKEAWGLDIGQSMIRLAKVQRAKGGVCLTDFSMKALATVPDEPEYDEKVAAALGDIIEEAEVGRKPVVVSLPGYAILFRDFPLPAISAGKLGEIVSYEARQQIPYQLEDVLWDYHRYQIDEASAEINIALVCCRRDIVAAQLEMLEEYNLNVVAIQVAPVALVNFLLYDQPPEGVSLILDSGAKATDFLVLNGGSFWMRSISVAGNDLAKKLMAKFNLPFPDAEDLKKKMGSSKQADRVFQVIAPVLRTLTGEVQRSLGYYKSLYRGVKVENVVGAGNTFKLNGADQFIADELGLPVSRINPLSEIEIGDDIDEEELNEELQAFAPAIGLALQGIGEEEIRINLLPHDKQRKLLVRQKIPYGIVAVLLLIAATVVSLLTAQEQAGIWKESIESAKAVVGGSGMIGVAKSKLENIQKKFAPAENKNLQMAKVAVNRGDASAALARFYKFIKDINKERAKLVSASGEEEKLTKKLIYDVLENPETMPEEIKKFKVESTDEDSILQLEQSVARSAQRKAKRIIDRQRRIIMEKVSVTAKAEEWFRSKKEKEQLVSPEKFTEMKRRLEDGGEDGDALDNDYEREIVYVTEVNCKGYAVGKQILAAQDVITLETRMNSVPGVYYTKVTPDYTRRTNSLPVVSPRYIKQNQKQKQNFTEVTQEPEEVQWTIYEEDINAFNLTLKMRIKHSLSAAQVEKKEKTKDEKTVKQAAKSKSSPRRRGRRRGRRSR